MRPTFSMALGPVAGVFDIALDFAGSGGAWPGDMAVAMEPNRSMHFFWRLRQQSCRMHQLGSLRRHLARRLGHLNSRHLYGIRGFECCWLVRPGIVVC